MFIVVVRARQARPRFLGLKPIIYTMLTMAIKLQSKKIGFKKKFKHRASESRTTNEQQQQ